MIYAKKHLVSILNKEILRQTFDVSEDQFNWKKVSLFIKILDKIDPLVLPSNISDNN